MNAKTYSVCTSCVAVNAVDLAQAELQQPVCGRCQKALPFHHGLSELGARHLEVLKAKSPLPVVVDFWASWCGPCRMFAPVFQEAAKRLAGQVVFVKVDTEAYPEVGGRYQIRGIPTLIRFASGQEVARLSGALPLESFLPWAKG